MLEINYSTFTFNWNSYEKCSIVVIIHSLIAINISNDNPFGYVVSINNY